MDRPWNPGWRGGPVGRARRGTGRAVRAPATAAAGTAGRCWTWRWAAARRRSARTAVGRVVLGVFGIGSRLETAVGGPGIEVGHGVHDAAAELAKAWAAAEHALLFQRARRQPQVLGGFVVGEIALGLRGSGTDVGGRPQGRERKSAV